ncbi:hypothetical protein PG994_003032 [Apiospora phragmitis]|uniref:Uncharacterized protein n=1 Tax=Apiospora phragmitis TaxID=2905665 RepID=A0ABR1W6V1_9PEZI
MEKAKADAEPFVRVAADAAAAAAFKAAAAAVAPAVGGCPPRRPGRLAGAYLVVYGWFENLSDHELRPQARVAMWKSKQVAGLLHNATVCPQNGLVWIPQIGQVSFESCIGNHEEQTRSSAPTWMWSRAAAFLHGGGGGGGLSFNLVALILVTEIVIFGVVLK